MSESSSTPTLGRSLERRHILMCVGPGGVGKTTTAAALALAAARSRKTLVVTIDPSLRLAQALGVAQARRGEIVAVDGVNGTLDALLLDARTVFDGIVRTCASSAEAARTILENPIYGAATQRLGGALEYAAMAQLQLLHADGRYDLIVLDTPPTANALDFLHAPQRVRDLTDNPATKVLVGTGRVGGKLLGLGANVLLKTFQSMGGAGFMRELGAFLGEFSDVLGEFQRRAGRFESLLTSSATGVVLTTSAAEFSVREAISFLRTLAAEGLHIDAILLNRFDPELPDLEPADVQQLPAGIAGAAQRVYRDAQNHGRRAHEGKKLLSRRFPETAVISVARTDPPPEDLEALAQLGAGLLG